MNYLEFHAIEKGTITKEEQEEIEHIRLILYLNKNQVFTLSREEKEGYKNKLNQYDNKLAAAG